MDSSKIEDLLECAICLEQLDERSRVLPCQHTFCMKCLGIIVESKGHLQCPECRSDFPQLSINNLPRNLLLVRILEGLKNKKRRAELQDGGKSENPIRTTKMKETAKRWSAKLKCDTLLNQPSVRGLYNFNSTEEGDLPFSKGDIITLVHEIDDNWWEGILKGKRGSIPKNFVETLVPLPKITDESIKTPFAKALYSYESKEEPELISFREGDIIGMIKKVDDNWLEGILGGQYGIFPVKFFQLNQAAKNVMTEESSSGTSSGTNSSDEDNENKKKRTPRRCGRSKNQTSPWVKMDQPTSASRTPEQPQTQNQTGDQPKRHTIHVENPNEQRRQSRRALNLSDDVDQPQSRSRAQSQGRRASESTSQEPRSLASSILLARALRTSDDQLSTTTTGAVSLPQPILTTSMSSRSDMALTFSTSPSTNTPSSLGQGELYTALFTYSPAQDDELALIQGDQYCVVEKHLDGWYKGIHIRSRQSGVFPGNYVKPSSQVTEQMMRNVISSPSKNVIGYGSNPSSPNAIPTGSSAFNFPPQRNGQDGAESLGTCRVTPRPNGENSSPVRSSGMSGIFKMLKKNKNKRQAPQTPAAPQAPPSYYHSSMPGPAHHRLSRPSPMVPAEPPPPYTPTPTTYAPTTTTTSSIPVIQTSLQLVAGEKFRAVATYPASHEDELTLHVGDIVYVTKKRLDGWYTGKSIRTGTTGVFPSTFVDACL